jgi:hypothetical protein
MDKDFADLPEQERLKAENEFLKMKLMLEHGMLFSGSTEALQNMPELENEFLRSVSAFENQWERSRKISVFEKIGKPDFFKPVSEIPDEEIEIRWNELFRYMEENGIYLQACSPNISARELYRFAIEELFKEEVDDMHMPGVQTCFIYDEFHPDPVYENSNMVEGGLFRDIFSKHELFYEINYAEQGFDFNGRLYEAWNDFATVINKFKSFYDDIKVTSFQVVNCEVSGKSSLVTGNYSATGINGSSEQEFKGDFGVELSKSENGYWRFNVIRIDGFDPV